MLTNYRDRRSAMRVGTDIARMAYGASKALYKNRAVLKEAAKKLWKSKPKSKPRRSTKANASAAFSAVGNELSTSKYKFGKYPKLNNNRLLKLLNVGMNPTILRYQGITNFDTNVGWHALANRGDPIANTVINPVHTYNLSVFPNTTTTTTNPGDWFYWNNSSSAGVITKAPLRGQYADGATDTSGAWHFEKVGSGDFRAPYANKIIHDWVDIRLLLYGARKRGTNFYIQLVQFTDEFMNPKFATPTNRAYVDWMRTMERNLIYSPLQSYNVGNINKKMRVLKSMKFYVPGGSADDLDTIGKVKEVRLFQKLGKIYNMKWESEPGTGDALAHTQADGIDFTASSGPQDYPAYSQQVYLIIRAFSPERRDATPAGPDLAADPLTEPSYDIIIRNKYSTPL